MCVKIVPHSRHEKNYDISEKKVRFVDEKEKEDKNEKSTMTTLDEVEFHEMLGHPSTELTVNTAKSLKIKLKSQKT